jgi:SAM-dependent methyltransferase
MWRVRLYVLIYTVFGKHPRIGNWVSKWYIFRIVMTLLANFDRGFSDRRYMSENILPAIEAMRVRRVLFVGCKPYTARYGRRLTGVGIDYWTTDIDPAAAMWGERNHHIVGDVTRIDDLCTPDSFDAVLLNGVIGDGTGLDEEDQMNRAVTAIARILRPNGILLIGWNSFKEHPDPLQLEAVATNFRHECPYSLPSRQTFPDTDHVYDWLVKVSGGEGMASIVSTKPSSMRS